MVKIKEEAEAYEEIKKFVGQKFKDFDYNIIVSIGKIDKQTKQITSMGFTFSTISGSTPFGIVKSIIANTIAQFQGLMNKYNIEPAQPIAQEKKKEEK
ncbi:MAG: hypothetical protein HYW50_04130 [Candidatus Diapherotrites archaeon]|nr:hypothetical protein [Candidatus Diapherotrites archaeon]